MKDEKSVVPSPALVSFDSSKAARDPQVQIELLRMAEEDGRSSVIAHANRVVSRARKN